MPKTFRALCDERHSAIEDEVTVLLDYVRLIGCEDVLVDFASTHWLLTPEDDTLDTDDDV